MINTKTQGKVTKAVFLFLSLAFCGYNEAIAGSLPASSPEIDQLRKSSVSLEDQSWPVTATVFKIDGEKDVNNVKIHWEQRQDADLYKVYRDRMLIGQSTGCVYDDYDLEVGKTYTYYVEAFMDKTKVAIAVPHQTTTFESDDKVFVYDNLNGKNNISKPRGFLIEKEYFSYSFRSIEKTVDDKVIKGRALYEKVSSDGLNDWTERELEFYPNSNFEGVQTVYNKKTKKVVVVAHFEDQGGYVAAKLYLAQIQPKGDLKVTFRDRPLGFESRDQSIFIDDDNTAYVLSATNKNNDINIYRLDDSWSKPVRLVNTVFKGKHRETPSIIKKEGKYYFFSSKASGWYPSQAMYASASDIAGTWSPLKETGNNSTFGTQFNSISSFGSERSTYGVRGYHWGAQYKHKDPDGNFARLLFTNFNAGYSSMEYYSSLEIHDKLGLIPVQAGKNLTIGKTVTANSADEDNGEISSVNDGSYLTSSKFFKGGTPYSLTIDMEKAASIAEINLSTRLMGGSEAAYKYTIQASTDGKTYSTIVDNNNNWQVGFQILKIKEQSPFRYLRFNINRVINVHNNNSAEWAEGIIEIAAFGRYNEKDI